MASATAVLQLYWTCVLVYGIYCRAEQVSPCTYLCSVRVPQVEACRPYSKYAVRLETLESAPFHVEKVSNHIWECPILDPVYTIAAYLHSTTGSI